MILIVNKNVLEIQTIDRIESRRFKKTCNNQVVEVIEQQQIKINTCLKSFRRFF